MNIPQSLIVTCCHVQYLGSNGGGGDEADKLLASMQSTVTVVRVL